MPPRLRECTDRPSLLKQAEAFFSKAALNIRYVLFKAAITLNSESGINYFLDSGVIEALKEDVVDGADLITLIASRKDVATLTRVLEKDDETGKVAKCFEVALRNAISRDESSNAYDLIIAISAKKPNIFSSRDHYGKTVLAAAIKMERYEIAHELIHKIEDCGEPSAYGTDDPDFTPLALAIGNYERTDVTTFKLLLEAKKAQFSSAEKQRALSTAIFWNRVAHAEKLLITDSSFLAEQIQGEEQGRVALIQAIEEGSLEMCNLILKHWTPKHYDDFAPLIRAAAKREMTTLVEFVARTASNAKLPTSDVFAIFKQVLSVGDVNQLQALFDGGLTLSGDERKRLMEASENLADSMKICLEAGKADIEGGILNNKPERALHFLKQRGVSSLTEHEDAGRWLFLAAKKGHMELCNALIDVGAPMNLVDQEKTSILMHMAKSRYNDGTRKAIEKAKADRFINRKNNSGITALMLAAAHSDLDTVKALLRAGAKVALKDKNGRTALFYAIQYGSAEVVAELFKQSTPSASKANILFDLAIRRNDSRLLELVARNILKVLNSAEHSHTAFGKLAGQSGNISLFKALIKAGFELDRTKLENLIDDKWIVEALKTYKRPPSAFVRDALEQGQISAFGAINFNYRLDGTASENWKFHLNAESSTHPVKAFLDSRPPLVGSEDVENHIDGCHPAVFLALRMTQSEEKESVAKLSELLRQPELRLSLIPKHSPQDPSTGTRIFSPAEKLQLENQFYSIAVSRNNGLWEILRNPCPDLPDGSAAKDEERKVNNQRAAWLQAHALVTKNENFRPFSIGIRWDVKVAKIENAVAENRLSAADALFQVEREIGELEALSDRFTEVLNSGLPETLQHWLGNQVIEQLEKRKKELDAAQARMINLLTPAEQSATERTAELT